MTYHFSDLEICWIISAFDYRERLNISFIEFDVGHADNCNDDGLHIHDGKTLYNSYNLTSSRLLFVLAKHIQSIHMHAG